MYSVVLHLKVKALMGRGRNRPVTYGFTGFTMLPCFHKLRIILIPFNGTHDQLLKAMK